MMNKDAVKALWGDADEELFFEVVEDNRVDVFRNKIINLIKRRFEADIHFKNGRSKVTKQEIDKVIDDIFYPSGTFDYCIERFHKESFNAGRVVERFQRDVNEVLFEEIEGE